jgi:hypothetical protein
MDAKLVLFTLTVFKNRVLGKNLGLRGDTYQGNWGSCITRNRVISLVTNYSDDQIKNEMGEARGSYGVHTCIQGVGGKA